MLIHAALHWTKTSRQLMLFLKLDSSKAYDKIYWQFHFHGVHHMGIKEEFINWVEFSLVIQTRW